MKKFRGSIYQADASMSIEPSIQHTAGYIVFHQCGLTPLGIRSRADLSTPTLQKPEGKKGGEKPHRSWNVPLVYFRNQVYICLRFKVHNVL
jgi:hypothetical protein